jgi:hypothetical protein
MLRTLSIHNFKCFEEFILGPLSRFNLLTGENDTGKTALLEALFLHIGARNPVLATNINTFRGMEGPPSTPEAFWGWHFRNLDFGRSIQLKGCWDGGREDLLEISLKKGTTSTQDLAGGAEGASGVQGTSEGTAESHLAYTYTPAQGGPIRGWSKIQRRDLPGKVEWRVVTESGAEQEETAHLLGSRFRVFSADAQRVNQLISHRKRAQVVEALKLLDARISDVNVEVQGTPLITADIGLPRMMPLPYAGEGLTRFVSMVVGVLSVPGGMLLIDEIENGLHHTVLLRVLRALMELAKREQVQIVATTHSRECVDAFYKASVSFMERELALFRIERHDGERRLIHYDQESLETAVQADFEVR